MYYYDDFIKLMTNFDSSFGNQRDDKDNTNTNQLPKTAFYEK